MTNKYTDLQEQAKKLERMIEQTKNNCNVQVINSCKYLLPCGRCDKSGELCSQYR